MNTAQQLNNFLSELGEKASSLIAVSKTHPQERLEELYQEGWRRFGENKVQELCDKYESLPKDIEWHLIGTLQSNKVKYIVPFIHLVHSVDRLKILKEIQKQALKEDRVIDCLLQIHIADEDSKSGFSYEEARALLLNTEKLEAFTQVRIKGLMGMATFTDDEEQIRKEFRGLKAFFEEMKAEVQAQNVSFKELSMGMSGDYKIALEEGSTMIRVGSKIFGARNYDQ